MAKLSREQRRMNRKHVLDALKKETGSSGGDAASARVDAYREDPIGASRVEFGYVGALRLVRFYVDPDMPDDKQRQSLWKHFMTRMGKPDAPFKDGWGSSSDVEEVQEYAEDSL